MAKPSRPLVSTLLLLSVLFLGIVAFEPPPVHAALVCGAWPGCTFLGIQSNGTASCCTYNCGGEIVFGLCGPPKGPVHG